MRHRFAFAHNRWARWALPGTFFALFVLSISYRLTPNNGVLLYGDYPYYWPGSANDGFSLIQSSFLGNIRFVAPSTSLLTMLPSLFSAVVPHSWTSYLLTYGLLYAVCVTYYFIASRLTGSRLLGYVAGLFVILNSVVLQHLLYMPSNIFAALMVYALTFHIIVMTPERLGVRQVLVLGLMSLAVTHPFLWVIDVGLIAGLFLYRVLSGDRVLRTAMSTLVLVLLLGSYWLIPSAMGSLSSSTSDIYAGNQQAVFEGLRAAFHYVQAFSLMQYGGGSWQAAYGGAFPYFFYFAIPAFVVAVFLARGRRGPQRKLFLLLLSLYLVSLSLGLGPNSAVTGRAWLYAYEHLPAFGFFRSFSRFISLTVVVLVLLVVLAFQQLRRDSYKYYGYAVGLFLVTLVVSQSVFFTGDLNGMTVAAKVPSEYASLNARLLDGPTDYSVLTYPNIGYEAYRWSANRNQRAFSQITYFKELYLRQPVVFNRLALNNLGIDNSFFPRFLAYDGSFEFYPSFDDDLNKLDVKYVLVHKDLFDNLRIGNSSSRPGEGAEARRVAGVDSAPYRSYFSANRRYRLVEDNSFFTVYENRAFRPRVRTERASFQKLNDSTYRVHLSGLRGTRELSLLQRFDPGWRLYPLPFRSATWCHEVSRYDNGLTECAKGGKGPDLTAVRRLVSGVSLRVPHTRELGYANEWSVSDSAIREQLPGRYYSANGDGSLDVELLMYYRPQSYFYLGILVTALTVAGSVAALCWSRLRPTLRTRRAPVDEQRVS